MGIFEQLASVAGKAVDKAASAAESAFEEAHGERLLSGVQARFATLEDLDTRIQGVAIVAFIQIRSRLNSEIVNVSPEGRRKLGRLMQTEADKEFDFRMAEGLAKWFAGAWLESKERTSLKAQQAHSLLDHFAEYMQQQVLDEKSNDAPTAESSPDRPPLKTHYDNLQVSRSATPGVIKAAYKSLAQKYHPDRFEGDPDEGERIFKLLNEAHKVLSDPECRRLHDKWIAEQEAIHSTSNKSRHADGERRRNDHEHSARADEFRRKADAAAADAIRKRAEEQAEAAARQEQAAAQARQDQAEAETRRRQAEDRTRQNNPAEQARRVRQEAEAKREQAETRERLAREEAKARRERAEALARSLGSEGRTVEEIVTRLLENNCENGLAVSLGKTYGKQDHDAQRIRAERLENRARDRESSAAVVSFFRRVLVVVFVFLGVGSFIMFRSFDGTRKQAPATEGQVSKQLTKTDNEAKAPKLRGESASSENDGSAASLMADDKPTPEKLAADRYNKILATSPELDPSSPQFNVSALERFSFYRQYWAKRYAAEDVVINEAYDSYLSRTKAIRPVARPPEVNKQVTLPSASQKQADIGAPVTDRGPQPTTLKANLKPLNAHWVFSGATRTEKWQCDIGFKQSGEGCVALPTPPEHGLYNSVNSDTWNCKLGYQRFEDRCKIVGITSAPNR
jgi:curved DNA-binding protein CbpA